MNNLLPKTEQLVEILLSIHNISISFDDEMKNLFASLEDFSNNEDVIQASYIAWAAHGNQKRNFSEELYIYHPFAVARNLLHIKDVDSDIICAAILHDAFEDTALNELKDLLEDILNKNVIHLIEEVTSPPSQGNREVNLKILCHKLEGITFQSKNIKLADIYCNSENLDDPRINRKFSEWYLRAQYAKLQALKNANESLFKKVEKTIIDKAEKMKISLILSNNIKDESKQKKFKKSQKF
jgi:hypothetical protein